MENLCIDLLRGSQSLGHAPKHFPAKQRGWGQNMQIKHSATILFTYFFGVTSEPSFNARFLLLLVVDSDPQYRQGLEGNEYPPDSLMETQIFRKMIFHTFAQASDATHRCSCTVLLICGIGNFLIKISI